MHYNENSARVQAEMKDGTERYDVRYPKFKKGGFVVRKVLQDATYSKSPYFSQPCAVRAALIQSKCHGEACIIWLSIVHNFYKILSALDRFQFQ